MRDGSITHTVKCHFVLWLFVANINDKINGQTAKNGVVLDTTSNAQPV